MNRQEADYFERRAGEELLKAEKASSLEVRHVHETIARLYRIRFEALTGHGAAA
jgi:hypothetical protein